MLKGSFSPCEVSEGGIYLVDGEQLVLVSLGFSVFLEGDVLVFPSQASIRRASIILIAETQNE